MPTRCDFCSRGLRNSRTEWRAKDSRMEWPGGELPSVPNPTVCVYDQQAQLERFPESCIPRSCRWYSIRPSISWRKKNSQKCLIQNSSFVASGHNTNACRGVRWAGRRKTTAKWGPLHLTGGCQRQLPNPPQDMLQTGIVLTAYNLVSFIIHASSVFEQIYDFIRAISFLRFKKGIF